MKSLSLLLLAAIASCAKPAAAPAPIAQTCPAGPRAITLDELSEMHKRNDACAEDPRCLDEVSADYADAVVSVKTLNDLARRPNPATSKALKELRELETASCACRDAACANHVQEAFEEWAKRYADTKGSQAEADQAGAIAERISECMMKAMTSGQP
jgi:hypothetical protein